MTPTTNNEPLELVTTREISPHIDKIRATLPMPTIEALELKVKTPGFSIEDEDEESLVNEYLRDCRTWTDRIETGWKPVKAFWHSVHVAACDAEKQTAPAIGRIRMACETAMRDWIKKKKERDRKAQEALDRQVELTRQKTLTNAAVAALGGDMGKAEELLKESQSLRTPVIMTGPTRLPGTGVKPVFVPTVSDLMALVKAIAEGKVDLMQPVEVKGQTEMKPLLVVNESALKFMANKLGHQLNWPGVTVTEDVNFAPRKR